MTTIVHKIARYGVRDLIRSRWLLGYARLLRGRDLACFASATARPRHCSASST